MNRIIKSGDLGDLVRPLAHVPPPSRRDEELHALRQRIASLESDIRQRDAAIEGLKADVKRAFEEGNAQGYRNGLSDAEDRQSERLSLLERGVTKACAELAENMASLERLSALLAHECLDIILGEAADRAEIVRRIIASQIARLDRAMLLAVEVSRQDFPDDDALGSVAAHTGLPLAILSADSEAPSGACSMQLRLGRIDVGIDQQWGVLRDLLDEISLPRSAG